MIQTNQTDAPAQFESVAAEGEWNRNVQDVMSFPAHACPPGETLVAAAAAMRRHGCGSLPIIDDDGCPVGILTERDICTAVARNANVPSLIPVREVMTADPFTCPVNARVERALHIMSSCRVRRLPVIDSKGKLVGVLSLTDVLEAMKDALELDVPLLRRALQTVRHIARPRRREGAWVPVAVGPATASTATEAFE
jgi:CBS domain-containing protein